jgi:hypothetical protein
MSEKVSADRDSRPRKPVEDRPNWSWPVTTVDGGARATPMVAAAAALIHLMQYADQ